MSSKIPEDYFNKLPGKIWQRIAVLDDDIQDFAPILSKINTVGMYELPPDYFKNLEGRIIRNTKRPALLRIGFYRAVAAACIVLLVGFSVNRLFQSELDTQELADNEILEYYIGHTEQLDAELLSYLETELENSQIEYFKGLSAAELEIYLSTVIDDVSFESLAEFENI